MKQEEERNQNKNNDSLVKNKVQNISHEEGKKDVMDKNNNNEKGKKTTVRKKISFKLSATIVIVINILLIAAIFYILGILSDKAIELKKLRNDYIDAERKGEVELADLHVQSYIDRSDYLTSLFPDEVGLIDFVRETERLKIEGVVKDFSFANENAVKDKTGVLGIPFILRLEGTWDQLNNDLLQLQKFPFLIRAVTVNIRVKDINTNTIDFIYGGFIYVDTSLEKN